MLSNQGRRIGARPSEEKKWEMPPPPPPEPWLIFDNVNHLPGSDSNNDRYAWRKQARRQPSSSRHEDKLQ